MVDGIAIFGVMFLALSSFCRNKKQMVMVQMASSGINGVANFLVGSFAAVLVNMMSLMRNFLVVKKKMTAEMIFMICVVSVLIGVAVNQIGVVGLLPMIGGTLYSLTMFFSQSPQSLRLALMINTGLWVVHDFYVGLVPLAIAEAMMMVVNGVNIYRYARKNYKKALSGQKKSYRYFYHRSYLRVKKRVRG